MCTGVMEEHAGSIFMYVRADSGGGGIFWNGIFPPY